jgi:hypothetical protein
VSEKTVPVAVPADAPSSETPVYQTAPSSGQPLETAPSQTEPQKAVVMETEQPPTPSIPENLGGIKASAAEAGEGSQSRAVAL